MDFLPDLFDAAGIVSVFRQFGAEISHPQFCVNLSKIIWINILLSGDNALVVALIWAGSALLGWIAGDVIATDPAVHPGLQSLFEGAMGIELDALLTVLGIAPLFVGGNGGEIVCAALGAAVVLLAGSIWRAQRLRQARRETAAAAG